MRLLLIEDNTVPNTEAISDYFKHVGHLPVSCPPAEAAETVQHQTFDLLILDINLPGKSGFQLLKQQRGFVGDIPI